MTSTIRIMAASMLAAIVALIPAAPSYADSYRDDEWHLGYLHVAEAQQISQGEGITVAVIDTGIEGNHPDLAGNVLQGLDVVPGGSGNGWGDLDGHGTGMAGLIAAHGHGPNNGDGIMGLAPKAKILPIRINTSAGDAGFGHGDAMANGLKEAIQRGAKIISISVETDGTARQAFEDALANSNVIVIAAAGNLQDANLIGPPASFRGVVAVGGVTKDGALSPAQIKGSEIALSAPGVDIASTSKITATTRYRKSTGASPSAAIVAGAAALVWAKYPQLTAQQVIRQLEATATDKGTPGRDEEFGYGIVDPLKALTAPLATATTTTASNPAAATTTAAAAPGDKQPAGGKGLYVVLAIVFLGGALAIAFVRWRRGSTPSI